MKNMPILLKRETWENPSFYVAPIVVMAIIILGALAGIVQGVGGTIGFNHLVTGLETVAEPGRSGVIFATFLAIATTFQIVLVFVIFFYLLDALYSERKERHILFWKSMPVSDMETVLSKVVTATIVIPLFFFVGVFVTKIAFLMITSIFIWIGDGSAIDLLWKPAPLFADFGISVFHILAAGLWMLPFTGWLLLSSSIAKKARPFMWAILLPIFIVFIEEIVFGTTRFIETIASYIKEFAETAYTGSRNSHSIEINSLEDLNNINIDDFSLSSLIDPVGVVSSPSLWAGIVIGVIFITAAIYLRRYRDDS